MIRSKINPKFAKVSITDFLPYMQFGQSACMFHISYGLQWRQGLRYIAVKRNKFCFFY